jgi:hypothetical protein
MCLDEYIPHQILYQVWIFYVELWLNIFKARSMKHDETDFDFVYMFTCPIYCKQKDLWIMCAWDWG